MTWRLPEELDRYYTCPLERDNPEPQPPCECECEHCCDCAANAWIPTITCGGRLAWRVKLVNGPVVDVCHRHMFDLEWPAHSEWASAFVGPIWEPPLDRVLKYLYRYDDLVARATRPHPVFDMLRRRRGDPPMTVKFDLRIGAEKKV